jgi:hypothetical protein
MLSEKMLHHFNVVRFPLSYQIAFFRLLPLDYLRRRFGFGYNLS